MGASSYTKNETVYKKLKNLIDLKPKGKFEIDLNFLIIINFIGQNITIMN